MNSDGWAILRSWASGASPTASASRLGRRRRRPRRQLRPLESLEERRVLAADFSGLGADLGATLGQLHAAVKSAEVLGASIPVVADQLAASAAADFLQQLAQEFDTQLDGTEATAAEVVTSLEAALTTLGGINGTVTTAVINADTQKFTISLDETIANQGVAFSTGLGADFLGADFIQAEADITASLRYQLSFDFVVDNNADFYLDTATDSFELGVGADLTGLNATADLGLLKVRVTDHPTNPTTLGNVRFAIDLVDNDGRLTPAETLDIQAEFSAAFNMNLQLRTDLAKYTVSGTQLFPELVADLTIDWQFVNEPTSGALAGTGAPSVSFDVSLDAGSLFADFVNPLLKPVAQIVEPLLPLVSVFQTAVPGFNDIGEVKKVVDGAGNGDGTANLIDFVYFYDADLGDSINSLVGVLDQFGQLIELASTVSATGLIPLGSFDITADLRTSGTPAFDVENSVGLTPNPHADPVSTIADAGAQAFFAKASNDLSKGNEQFRLDIVEDPLQAFRLLLDQDATLFTWDLPTISIANQEFTLFEIPIFPGLLSIGGNATFGAMLDLEFGYDTRGLRQFVDGAGSAADVLFGGIFLPAGDQPIVTLQVGIEMEGSAGQGLIGSAAAGIDTGAEGIQFTLADVSSPTNDGKVYLADLGIGLTNDVYCLFEITGSIVAYVEGELEVGVEFDWVSATETIAKERFAEAELVSFTTKCDQGADGEAELDEFAATIATRLPDGTLRLNMGPFAAERGEFNRIDGSEDYTVIHRSGAAGDEEIEVRAFGFSYVYSHINHVYAQGGVGDDRVVLEGVLSTAAISGGIGGDTLTVGPGADDPDAVQGAALLDGQEGDDLLTGGSAADVLRGGAGHDILKGRGADDDLDGGSGDDELYGDEGHDFVVAGHGHDRVDGGEGDDHLYGDEGNDEISGGTGNDEIYGGDDDDQLVGNAGDDFVVGGGGSDTILWTHLLGAAPEAADVVDGNDTIDGAEGTDRVIVQTSSEDETLLVESLGSHVFVRRTTGGVFTLSLIAAELLGINLGTGQDTISVRDTAGSDLEVLQINMGSRDTNPDGYATVAEFLATSTFVPDTDADSVIVQAGPANDLITAATVTQADRTYVEVNGLAPRVQLFDSIAADDSLRIQGGAGNDQIKAFPGVEAEYQITLAGEAGDDQLSADAVLLGGDGDDLLEGLPLSNDTFNGGAGFDTLLIRGTPGNDVILLTQTSAAGLTVNSNGAIDLESMTLMEAARIEGGDGADLVAISVADDLAGSLHFRVEGGTAIDRLVVNDAGLGDLVIHRQGDDDLSGSITVGPLAPVDYQGIELVDITPIDGVSGRTGANGDGRLLVIPADPYEANPTRLVATPLGGQPTFIGNLSIDPGPVTLPGEFGNLGGDEDWFELKADKIDTLRFEALFAEIGGVPSGRPGLPNNGNLELAVFSEAGTLIAESTGAGDNASVDVSVATDHSYFVRVRGASGAINVYDLRISAVDLAGPVVTDLFITEREDFDLFALKPADIQPTPGIQSLTIELEDSVPRAPGDLYAALNVPAAANLGHFVVRGDHYGIVAIQSVTVTNFAPAIGARARATITLTFADYLPDDRFTFTISDEITDPVGNGLDGNSHAAAPAPVSWPSGDGVAGGDLIARFTVDSRPEVGTVSQGVLYLDVNGNAVWDPEGQDNDATNRDFVLQFGTVTDAHFAGNFAALNAASASGFDKAGAYGRFAGTYSFWLDTNDDGVGDTVAVMPSAYQVNGIPLAGEFNAQHPGDEIGLFDGAYWYLDQNGNNLIDLGERVASDFNGLPLAGDFNGDGQDDLAAYDNATNTFRFDLDRDGHADDTWQVRDAAERFTGLSGFTDRPVAGDMNLDGVDDLGVWVKGRSGQLPATAGEFFFWVSDAPSGLPSSIFADFSPAPLGNDQFMQFGSEDALPIFGNFDPPVAVDADLPRVTFTWQRAGDSLDVNGDGSVSPIDALLVINALNLREGRNSQDSLRFAASLGDAMVDTDGSGTLSPLDALLVINALNSNLGEAEGEADHAIGSNGNGSQIQATAADRYFEELSSAVVDQRRKRSSRR